MDFIGAAYAMLMTSIINMSLAMIYMKFYAECPVGPLDHYEKFTRLMKLKAVTEYLHIALPLIAMVCS